MGLLSYSRILQLHDRYGNQAIDIWYWKRRSETRTNESNEINLAGRLRAVFLRLADTIRTLEEDQRQEQDQPMITCCDLETDLLDGVNRLCLWQLWRIDDLGDTSRTSTLPQRYPGRRCVCHDISSTVVDKPQ
jgi:hypothetical protein